MDEEIPNQEAIMGLIINGGNAKGSSFEAIEYAKKGDFDHARDKLKEADDFLSKAHNSQTGMLTNEANGIHMPLSLLGVHAQDHIMTAITFRDLASEIIDLYALIDQKLRK